MSVSFLWLYLSMGAYQTHDMSYSTNKVSSELKHHLDSLSI